MVQIHFCRLPPGSIFSQLQESVEGEGAGGGGGSSVQNWAAIIGNLFCFIMGITEKLKHFLKITAWRDFSTTPRGGSRKIREGTSRNVSAIIRYY